jgi:hypothetical protein
MEQFTFLITPGGLAFFGSTTATRQALPLLSLSLSVECKNNPIHNRHAFQLGIKLFRKNIHQQALNIHSYFQLVEAFLQ